MYGICNLSIVPCRKEPSDRSEMVTQLLFGEHFKIIEEQKSWVKIQIAYDHYECWIDKKQFLPLKNLSGIKDSNTAVTSDLIQLTATYGTNKQYLTLVLGSSLPKLHGKDFLLGREKYAFEGEYVFPFSKSKKILHQDKIETFAYCFLNAPYLWGGRSPFGVDCSGFTQIVFKLLGIKLRRDAWQQAEQGKVLSFFEEAQKGDLAFFDNEEGKITHVGIFLNHGKIIHSSGKVRVDSVDHEGIYNVELKKYTHRLRIIKRIF